LNREEFFGNVPYWCYARTSHWPHFDGLDVELTRERIEPAAARLKNYQDLLIMMIIKNFVPSGSRILEVGGGTSRILKHFAATHECWNVDKFEGLGHGPTKPLNVPYRVVYDYMGNFNAEIPTDYFDFAFSISALEHVPDPTLCRSIVKDIDRTLRPGGLSAHLLDISLGPGNKFGTNMIAYHMFEQDAALAPLPSFADMGKDPDVYSMSRETYDKYWLPITRVPFDRWGRPTSLNAFWRKSL
jgi:ubiquinone/menaquinone biosynthesis C-methylase UbiE